MTCPTTEELVLLLDGELTENRAAAVREHLVECSGCARELATLRGLVADVAAPIAPRPDALDRILARIDDAPAPPRRGQPRWALGLVAVVAAAAIAVLVPSVVSWRRSAEFAARGGGPGSLARDVGVAVYRAGERLEPLHAGAEVSPSTAYAVATRNLGPDGSAYVLVFAEDAAGQVHWIAPAWTDPAADPAPAPLPHADRETAPSSATVLEGPAPGAMRIFTVVAPRAIHVSAVERAALLGDAALRAAMPDAVVDVIEVRVLGGSP